MKKGLLIALFILVAIIQIVAPLSMIIKRESVLKNGVQFKFRVAPVDPFDAFRGRYVAIKIEDDKIPVPEGTNFNYGQKVYALIAIDAEGFAKLFKITTVRPKNEAYIDAKVDYISKGNIYLGLPIDRYYMEEAAAPKAERLYRQHAMRGDNKRDAYILVKIKDGFPVIEQLYVGGARIEEAVKNIR